MLFWERFSGLCNDHKLKPNPVASEIGIASGTLSKWKEGKTFPNGETLIKISKYFGCSIDYLLGISDLIYPSKNEISPTDLEILEKLHSLSKDNQDMIIHLLNYQYEQLQKKRKEPSSPILPTLLSDSQDLLAWVHKV